MGEAILNFLATSGLASITWQQAVMLLVSFVLMYLAIVKQYEPLLLLPIAFGMFLANMPLGGIADDPSETVRLLSPEFLAPYLQQLGLGPERQAQLLRDAVADQHSAQHLRLHRRGSAGCR